MLVHKKKRVLVIRSKNPEHITATIPTAKAFQYKGATLVAVPHKLDEVRVLRNMGIKAPSPILHYYDWPRNKYTVPNPFFAQTETAAFFTYHPRSYCNNGLGAGKTLAALWSYDYLRSIGERKRLLVVSTLSTLDRAWGDTIFEHFPHLTFSVLHGSKEKRLKLLNQLVDDGLFADDFDQICVRLLQRRRGLGLSRWSAEWLSRLQGVEFVVDSLDNAHDDRSTFDRRLSIRRFVVCPASMRSEFCRCNSCLESSL